MVYCLVMFILVSESHTQHAYSAIGLAKVSRHLIMTSDGALVRLRLWNSNNLLHYLATLSICLRDLHNDALLT